MRQCEGRARVRPEYLRRRDKCHFTRPKRKPLPTWADTLLFAIMGLCIGLVLVALLG